MSVILPKVGFAVYQTLGDFVRSINWPSLLPSWVTGALAWHAWFRVMRRKEEGMATGEEINKNNVVAPTGFEPVFPD